MNTDKIISNKRIDDYFALMNERPELFVQSYSYPIITDRDRLSKYEAETNKPVGVIYGYGSPFYMLVVDLIDGKKGPFTYSRIIYTNKSNGSVVIPCFIQDGKEPMFGLLDIYRHPIRGCTGLEFPRGFANKFDSPEQDALRELKEELCLKKTQTVDRLISLGDVRADAGLSGGKASVFLACITGEAPVLDGTQEEGIKKLTWLSESELLKEIRENKITDGFTLSAFLMFLSRK